MKEKKIVYFIPKRSTWIKLLKQLNRLNFESLGVDITNAGNWWWYNRRQRQHARSKWNQWNNGLQSSSARCHDKFSDTMRALNFFACKSDPDFWMRKSDKVYAYVAVLYVYDHCNRIQKSSFPFSKANTSSRLKEVVLLIHIVMHCYHDDDGTLCITSL